MTKRVHSQDAHQEQGDTEVADRLAGVKAAEGCKAGAATWVQPGKGGGNRPLPQRRSLRGVVGQMMVGAVPQKDLGAPQVKLAVALWMTPGHHRLTRKCMVQGSRISRRVVVLEQGESVPGGGLRGWHT